MAEALLIRLAQEECVYLLRALKIESLGALTVRSLGNLDADHQSLAMAVADRTLRARQLVHWTGNEDREVDAYIAGVLRAAAHPRYTLALDLLRRESSSQSLHVVFADKLAVEYAIVEPGVYQFVASSNKSDVLAHLDDFVLLGDTAEGFGPTRRLSRETWEAAHSAKAEGATAVERVLASFLPQEFAAGLAAAISAPDSVLTLSIRQEGAYSSQSADTTRQVVVLCSTMSAWLITMSEQPHGYVTVAPAHRAQVQNDVRALIEPGLTLLEE